MVVVVTVIIQVRPNPAYPFSGPLPPGHRSLSYGFRHRLADTNDLFCSYWIGPTYGQEYCTGEDSISGITKAPNKVSNHKTDEKNQDKKNPNKKGNWAEGNAVEDVE